MDAIIEGFSLLLEIENIILITLGVLIGVLVGALPGLSSPMAIALLTPFTDSAGTDSRYRHDGRIVLCGDFRWIYYSNFD